MSGDTKWLPLESNPEFLRNLGLPKDWSIVDVLGLDYELLLTVPKPVAAILLLFPISKRHEDFVSEKAAEIKEKGQVVSDKVYFMQQTVKNACGTVALVHALANSLDLIKLADSPLRTFLDATAGMSPEERAKYLEECQAFSVAHEECAQEGQTEAPSADENVNLHFICLANVDGHIYDLDGRKPFPLNMGPTSDENFLVDASNVCKEYIARDPDNLQFTVLALAAANE
ncbi:ubiquitin carboxyl-terminal hydrolase isozyme L3-like isoform X2 [Ornithodoros turicata]|uniref:ubiquitin carboxyl-terminal hydrolase isozyme L3-like isoform X2 n=1 Tax=Ornithodoros turicata TaxID=34597 RepID=UPI003139B5CD